MDAQLKIIHDRLIEIKHPHELDYYAWELLCDIVEDVIYKLNDVLDITPKPVPPKTYCPECGNSYCHFTCKNY